MTQPLPIPSQQVRVIEQQKHIAAVRAALLLNAQIRKGF